MARLSHASARANYLLKVVKPASTRGFAQRHKDGWWKCLCEILHVEADQSAEAKLAASMPLNLGGMGLRDVVRVAVPAYWARWADCMPMIFNRHPNVANLFVHELEGAREGAVGAAAEARRAVTGVLGFDPPTWEDLAHGACPPPAEPEDMEPWSGRGWQHVAASKVEYQHGRSCSLSWGRATERRLRSQAGPGACMALSAAPTHYLTRIPPHLFRVVLMRRLRFPLPLSLHTCRCCRQIDKFGHHRASCARAGVAKHLWELHGRAGRRGLPQDNQPEGENKHI